MADNSTKVTVTKKTVKPIEVGKTPKGGGETPVAKDPKGMFNYVGCKTYTVKEGDTLYDVAQKYTVALQQLRYFNHIDRNDWTLTPGKKLYIPKEPIHVPRGK